MMFKPPISISFAPNFQADDVALSLAILMGKKQDQEKDSIKELKRWFCNYTGHKYVFCFSSGRAGLYFALQSLSLNPKSEVALQSFTCVAVPNSILWADLLPLYVDIDQKTYNIDIIDLERKITKNTRAVLIQHTFGIPANIDAVLGLAKKHHLVIIEDCAHSLGAQYRGKPVGSFGDVSFFSFGRDKVVSSVFGGVVTTNNKNVAQQLALFEKNLLNPPNQFVQKQLLYPFLYAIANKTYQVGLGKFFLWSLAKMGILTPAVFPEEKQGKKPEFINYSLSPKLALLALHQLGKLVIFNNHRKKIAAVYAKSFGEQLVDGAIYLRFPVQVVNQQKTLYSAKKRHIHLGNWYLQPVYPSDNSGGFLKYIVGQSKTAERVCQHIVNLPTHINIAPKEAQLVCDMVK